MDTTRFHPTFYYEMILNVLAFLFILWYSRRHEETAKPGTLFSLWLIFAGFNRVLIEFFRPDQPRLGDTFITTSMLVAFLMGVTGVVLYLARYGKLNLALTEGWEEDYFVKPTEKKPASSRARAVGAESAASLSADASDQVEKPVTKRKATAQKKPAEKKPAAKKAPVRRKKTEE